MVTPIRYPDTAALVTDNPDDAPRIATLAHAELSAGRAVNIIFEHGGARSLVSRILRSGYGFHVGHGQRSATKHAATAEAVAAALQSLNRSAMELTDRR